MSMSMVKVKNSWGNINKLR